MEENNVQQERGDLPDSINIKFFKSSQKWTFFKSIAPLTTQGLNQGWCGGALYVILMILVSFLQGNALFASKAKINVV